jgi:hypothetical protein
MIAAPPSEWLAYSRSILGWMSDDELTWLYEQSHGKRLIVEVGVWRGRSLSALAAGSAGNVIGVDCWNSQDLTYTQLAPHGQDAIYCEAQKNLARFGDRVQLIRGDSKWAAKLLADRSIDMLFIDGDHNYEGVKADLDLLLPLCAPDAVVCGHDCGMVGVLRAIRERFGMGLELAVAGSIWRAV